MTFDDALSIVTRPTPAQAWLASVKVPLPDPPEDVYERSIVRLGSLRSGSMACRIEHVLAGNPEPDAPDCCAICGLEDCVGCLVECDMTAYKRYRDVYGEEEI